MPTRTPSLPDQLNHALKSIFHPGESRHAAKASGKAVKHIYSYGTLDRYHAACKSLLNVLPAEERPKWLKDISTTQLARGIALLRERGNSDSAIQTQLLAWRKLGYALNHLGWSRRDPRDLVPDDLVAAKLERSRPQGPVSPDQVIAWRAAVAVHAEASRLYRDDLLRMFDLCYATGVRIEEAAKLQTAMIDHEASVIHITKNIAKNGRNRDVPLDTPEALAAMAAIPAGRHYLWTDGLALARRLQDLMHDTGEAIGIDGPKGPHRLRASYAEAFILGRLAEGVDEDTARLDLSHRLGHNRVQVTYRYILRLTPRRRTRRKPLQDESKVSAI